MARGFFGGLLIGGAVALGGAAILSVVAFPPSQAPQPPAETLPSRPAAQVASEDGAPKGAIEEAAPQTVPQAPAPVVAADGADPVLPDPLPDPAPAPQGMDAALAPPQTTEETAAPAGSSVAPDTAGLATAAPQQPAAPDPDAAAPARSEAAPQPGPITAPDAAATPELAAETGQVSPSGADAAGGAPQGTTAPVEVAPPAQSEQPRIATDTAAPQTGTQAPASAEQSPAPTPAPVPVARELPTVTQAAPEQPAPEPNPAPAPVDVASEAASEADTELAQSGLPRIGRPATSLIGRGSSAAPAPETAEAVQSPPLARFAVPFDPAETRPLLGIVLMDQGKSLGDSAVGVAALGSFPYPLTIAVDASLPDAETRMAQYRGQGFEVMALVDLPEGMTASETEVTLTAALAAVPEAVAVLEGPGTGLQGGREMSDQVSAIMAATGHGIVWRPKGLDTAQKLAAREGVASQTLFRDFDSEGQTPSVIRRFLDQAAFKAGQQGAVIMVGRLRPDTISALLLWGLQDRASRVAVAPISAVLRAGLGG